MLGPDAVPTITVVQQTFDLATIRAGSNAYADISTIGGLAIKNNIFAMLFTVANVTASGSATGSHWQCKFSYDDGSTFSATSYSSVKFIGDGPLAGDGTNFFQDSLGAATYVAEVYNLNVAAPTVGHRQDSGTNDFGTFQHNVADVVDVIRIELDWTSGGPLTSIGGTVTIYGIAINQSKIEVETFDLTQAGNQINELTSTLNSRQTFALVVCNQAVRSGAATEALVMVGRNGTIKRTNYAIGYAFDNTTVNNSQSISTAGRHTIAAAQAAAVNGWTMLMNMNCNAPVWLQTYYNMAPNVDNTKNRMATAWTTEDPDLTSSKFNEIRIQADYSTSQTWGTTGTIYVIKVQAKATVTKTTLSGTTKTLLNGSQKGFSCLVSAGDAPSSLTDAAASWIAQLGLADSFLATSSYTRGHHAYLTPNHGSSTAIQSGSLTTASAAGTDTYFGARFLGLSGTIFKGAFGASMTNHANTNYRTGFETGFIDTATAYDQVRVVGSGAGFDAGEFFAVDYS